MFNKVREISVKLLLHILASKLFNKVPDPIYLKIKYRLRTGKKLNLENPTSYNEKIQWLKMYYRKPEHVKFVDKYAVREYVKETLGSEYLIPVFGFWDNVNDIDFENLPDSFILKCTHDSGSFIKCTDKSKFNVGKAKRKLNRNLKRNYYYKSREWLYKDVQPRIICEELLKEDDSWDIPDYKVFCFDGVVKFIRIKYCIDGVIHKQTFDINWNLLKKPDRLETDVKIFDKPEKLLEMMYVAETLSAGLPMLRADLYIINQKIYFGEMTFYHGSGYESLNFEELESKMDNWFKLPLTEKLT